MAGKQSLEEWVRTAYVPRPPRWGELEADLLTRIPGPERAHGGAVSTVVYGLFVLLYGAPWIALAIIATSADPRRPLPEAASYAVMLAFGVALLMVYVALADWRDAGRRRDLVALLVTGGTAVAAVAAYVVARPTASDWAGWLALATAAFALGVFLAIAVASRPGPGTRLPLRVRVRTFLSRPSERHYVEARNRALESLVERHQIARDDVVRADLARQPLGSWHALDRD